VGPWPSLRPLIFGSQEHLQVHPSLINGEISSGRNRWGLCSIHVPWLLLSIRRMRLFLHPRVSIHIHPHLPMARMVSISRLRFSTTLSPSSRAQLPLGDSHPLQEWDILSLSSDSKFISITLFSSIALLCGTDSIMWNIPHIHVEREEYFANNC
jgi:hypothetical protein